MTYKFCENHLADLYEAVKNNDIEELQKVEHELSTSEECVACTYAFRAKGQTRDILLEFLKEEGVLEKLPRRENFVEHITYWGIRGGILVAIFMVTYPVLRSLFEQPWGAILASALAGGGLLVYSQFFD